jgi:16S rRNA (guanine1207-N2)-methyltransferase
MRMGRIHAYIRGIPFEFLTASGVFSRRRVDLGTRLLVDSMILPRGGFVLDVGCGYGVVGIAAATLSPDLRVIMVDVNERAVWLARRNIETNHVSNAEVRTGELYEPVEGLKFSCILSNPPVSAGMETIRAIVAEAPGHMLSRASFEMVVRSKIGGERLRAIFGEAFGSVEVLARKSGYRVFIAEKA